MDGEKPFWFKVAEAIEQIHGRSFLMGSGRSYAVSGPWSTASHRQIKDLLVRCKGVEPGEVRIGQGQDGISRGARSLCAEKGISHPGNRTVYEVHPKRLDHLSQNLLSDKPKLELVCEGNPLTCELRFAGEDEMLLRDDPWYHDTGEEETLEDP